MPQQLIYTSAPRGVVAGRSGHCTVARSANLREAVMLQVEKFCYYQHLSLSGGQERPIFTCRVIDIRGTRFHVLSRIQDAGLDFTGRTNFIAHHLVFTPEEIRQFAAPPLILRDWPGWRTEWTHEPQLFENEDWSSLTLLAGKTSTPAQTWEQLTGDAVNGYGLLEARAGASFRVDDVTAESVLTLMAESLELLEVRDPRKDFRSAIWQYTFTTSLQEQDNPADFRWRCIHSDNPTASRFTPPDCKPLTAVRASKWTAEEVMLARHGRQVPHFVAHPQNVRVEAAQTARFTCQAEGIPTPVYEWFTVDRASQVKILPGETKAELVVANPPLGISRYMVRASNSVGQIQSGVVSLSVEQPVKPARIAVVEMVPTAQPRVVRYSKSEEEIDQQRRRLDVEQAEAIFRKRLLRNNIIATLLASSIIAIVAIFAGWKLFERKPPILFPLTINTNASGSISIIASVAGTPPFFYQWYNDKQPVSSALSNTFSLTDLTKTNYGSFYVVITNRAGSATSKVISWLGTPPEIERQPYLESNKNNMNIQVNADGETTLSYQWFNKNQLIPNATNFYLPKTNTGSFQVVITNLAGAVTSTVFRSQESPVLSDPGTKKGKKE